jgi:hypothetical protein
MVNVRRLPNKVNFAVTLISLDGFFRVLTCFTFADGQAPSA